MSVDARCARKRQYTIGMYMALKDSAFSWFIQHILNPKMQKLDSPGFIVTVVSGDETKSYRRLLFLEEPLISHIEQHIVNKYKERGKQALYAIGKQFGYNYASLSNFPQIGGTDTKKFLTFTYFLTRFITTTYASAADYNVTLKNKRFEIEVTDYVVCSKNGIGYIMAEGGISGIWAYMVKDKAVEGVQLKCQGRGDKSCIIVAEPDAELKKEGITHFRNTNITLLPFNKKYKDMNTVRKVEHAKNSLKSLLDLHFFKYEKGMIKYHDIRYLMVDSNLIYIIENEIRKLPKGADVLFDICFEHGKYLQKEYGSQDYEKFINDYFPSLGWGDVFTIKKGTNIKIVLMYYPWSVYSDTSDYLIPKGIISGFISGCLSHEVRFKRSSGTATDNLTIVCEQ